MGTKVRRRAAARRSRDPRTRTIASSISPSAALHVPVVDASSNPAGCSVFSDDAWRHLARVLRLSGRELEILQAVFDDQKESTIAADLGISTHTVHTHLERLYRKLRVSSRVALVVRVIAEHLSNRPY